MNYFKTKTEMYCGTDTVVDANAINWNQYEQSNDLCASLPLDIESLIIPNMEELEQVNNQNIGANELIQQLTSNHDLNNIFVLQQQQQQQQHQPLDLFNTQNFLTNNYASIQTYRNYVTYSNEHNQIDINQSNENVSKVDILNQVISNVNNRSSDLRMNNYEQISNDNYTIDSRQKIGKIKNSSRVKCNVCGNLSSGYHYGAHTCEACKLFFRRAEKQIRKTGFPDCPKKNCPITSESRASCANCRYKKCIAAGMSMTRSRYGRRTDMILSTYTPNISHILCDELNQIKMQVMKKSVVSVDDFNEIIMEFYSKVFNTLNSVENSSNSNSSSSDMDLTNDYSYGSNSPFSEFSTGSRVVLPNSTIILFCVLFDLKSKLLNATHFTEMIKDYENYFEFLKQNVLGNNELVPMLKIGIYIKVLRVLFEKIPVRDHPVDKRISDLMRSEFACFKNTTNDSTSYVLLLSQLNHLLFKHMTKRDIEAFLNLPKEINN